jgi:hypothetical protein
MAKKVSDKMGLKPGMRAIYLNAPTEAVKAIEAPTMELIDELNGDFDYIHFFVRSQAQFCQTFPSLKSHLKPTGMLWVSWPKAKREGSDLTLITVIQLGYDYGLVESTCLSVNPIWSALKFTHPKPGKTYHNKYGTLKS